VAGSDIRYPLRGYDHHALIATFAPDLALRTDRGATSDAELMHTARPVFVDLADRPDLRETARDWEHLIDIHTAATDDGPADALLIRPDAHIAWAATIDEPTGTAARSALRLVRHAPENDSAHHRSALLIGRPNIARSAVERLPAERHDRLRGLLAAGDPRVARIR
jgi:hypothetical protein